MSAVVGKKCAASDGNIIASQVFAQVFQAYLECSDEVQTAIREMVEIVNDPQSTDQEVNSALLTIAEALFPAHRSGSLGADLQQLEDAAPADVRMVLEHMNQEEATFAERVNAVLEARGMNQRALADASGVLPSAISMMLSRECRPQRRTVEKIAIALEIPANDLWPN